MARAISGLRGNVAEASVVSPSASRSVASTRGGERPTVAPIRSTSSLLLPFAPPFALTTLRNGKGQQIVEVCIWLQSGVRCNSVSLSVSDDFKYLNYKILMDKLMGNGWMLHKDMVPNADNISKQERMEHVHVHHWNSFIDEMRDPDGGLPWFSSQIELPRQVCSKTIIRKSGKSSRFGVNMLVVDLLVEDTKLPANEPNDVFHMINVDSSDDDEEFF